MELRRALTIFRLKGRVPVDELNSSFRELVKKYHPDKVHDYPDWAHERMSEINDAYETLALWLTRPKPKKSQQHSKPSTEQDRYRPGRTDIDEAVYLRDVVELTPAIKKILYPAFNQFLNGLGVYYQYGLERPTYRNEGIRRFRYREAIRLILQAGKDIELLFQRFSHPAIKSILRFMKLTVAEMDLGEPTFPEYMKYRRHDNRLRNARRAFDDAVKEYFFPELIPTHLRGRATARLYACYADFVVYHNLFLKGERRRAGVLMTARYDSFMELAEYRREGILQF